MIFDLDSSAAWDRAIHQSNALLVSSFLSLCSLTPGDTERIPVVLCHYLPLLSSYLRRKPRPEGTITACAIGLGYLLLLYCHPPTRCLHSSPAHNEMRILKLSFRVTALLTSLALRVSTPRGHRRLIAGPHKESGDDVANATYNATTAGAKCSCRLSSRKQFSELRCAARTTSGLVACKIRPIGRYRNLE
jgi:hypothetical protein